MTTILLAFGIISTAVWGFILYMRNIFEEETQHFLIIPWIVSSFLAGLDWANIIFSEERSWIEMLGGGLMFFGPLWISVSILKQGLRIHGGNKKLKFFWQKIRAEYSSSPTQTWIVVIGMIILVLLVYVEKSTQRGGEYWIEFTFAAVTILLDLIVVAALVSEVFEYPKSFEKRSWTLWVVAAAGTYLWNISEGAHWASIGSLLVFESALMSSVVLVAILYKQRQG